MSNNRNIKVTVAIPVFNAESFVREAIESVIKQDYDSFELLILNDGSTDNSYEIIKEYKSCPKVRVYSQPRKGVASARNRLLKLSYGKYISPHDADDVMLPGKIQKQVNFLDRNSHIGIVHGKAIVINKNGYPLGYFGGQYNKEKSLFKNTIPHSSVMVRKSCILQVGGYDEGLSSCIDYDLWLKLIEIVDFAFLDSFFCLYRKHKKNLTSSVSRNVYINNLRKIKEEALKRRHNKIP